MTAQPWAFVLLAATEVGMLADQIGAGRQAEHSAYVVGGEDRLLRQIERKFHREGLHVVAHSDGRAVNVPHRATVVVVLGDMVSHMAMCTARDQACKMGVPWVLGSFKAWHITRHRLREKGVFGSVADQPDKRTLTAKLSDSLAPEKREALAMRIKPQIVNGRKLMIAPKPADLSSPPAPAPATEESAAPAPTATAQPAATPKPATPAEMDKDTVAKEPKKRQGPDGTPRQGAIYKVLKAYDGQILNTEVMHEVRKTTGLKVSSGEVTAARKKHKFILPTRGGTNIVSTYKGIVPRKKAAARRPRARRDGPSGANGVHAALADLVAAYAFENRIKEAHFVFDLERRTVNLNVRRLKVEEVSEDLEVPIK